MPRGQVLIQELTHELSKHIEDAQLDIAIVIQLKLDVRSRAEGIRIVEQHSGHGRNCNVRNKHKLGLEKGILNGDADAHDVSLKRALCAQPVSLSNLLPSGDIV